MRVFEVVKHGTYTPILELRRPHRSKLSTEPSFQPVLANAS